MRYESGLWALFTSIRIRASLVMVSTLIRAVPTASVAVA
jgi:hypothetical protein